ncbi:MAG: succinate--CoA ligase subunit alpha [Sphingobium sp.]
MTAILDQSTPVIAIGATGPYGQAQIAFMQGAGTNIVGLVAPGRGGTTTGGLPTFDIIADAVTATGAKAAMIYTPALGVKDALIECADAGLTLAVAAAEFVPLHDARIGIAHARSKGMWVVGPNTAGMAAPGKAMLGAIATGLTLPGRTGVIGRSGTLTMTIARLLTNAGVGQSLVIHAGGDMIAGANPVDWLKLMLDDEGTDQVVYLGEIGGSKEYAMLDVIRAATKPVYALIVGRRAPAGKRMGHAGALIGGEKETAQAKRQALRDAGAIVVDSPAEISAAILNNKARKNSNVA